MVEQMRNVVPSTGKVIIHAQDFTTILQKPLAKMGANEARPASDQNPLVHDHDDIPNAGDGDTAQSKVTAWFDTPARLRREPRRLNSSLSQLP
jgi:hypothetical protein